MGLLSAFCNKIQVFVRSEPISGQNQFMLAHDLNNRLNVILGRCQLLKHCLDDDPEAVRHLESIENAARHMAELVADRLPHQLGTQPRTPNRGS